MMYWLTILVSSFTLLAGAALAQPPTPGATVPVAVVVDGARVFTQDDGTLALRVVGSKGTGCDLPVNVEQRLEGDTLYVDLYELAAIDQFCPMILIYYDEVIPLDYQTPARVVVNGVEVVVSGDSQSASPAPNRIPHIIEQVVLDHRANADGSITWLLTVTGYQPDSCEFPVIVEQVESRPEWLVVEIYREVPANVRCAGAQIPYSATLEVEGDFNPDPTLNTFVAVIWVVEVNDFIGLLQFEQPQNGPLSIDHPVIVPTERVYVTVNEVQVDIDLSDPEQRYLIVTGTYPDGCIDPLLTRQVLNGDTITIDIYTPAPPEPRPCPRILRQFTLEVFIEQPLDEGTYVYSVNGLAGYFTLGATEEPMPSDTIRSYHAITHVEALILESFPPQVSLLVTGYQMDGCQAEVHVDTRVDGEDIYVEIYRLLPMGVMCPAVIVDYSASVPLGALQPGRYTIHVNDFVLEVELQ